MPRTLPRLLRAFLALVLAVSAVAPAALAQQPVRARASSLRLGGRVQVQYARSSVDAAVADAFLRRAWVEMDGRFDDALTGRLWVDFGGGSVAVRDAWARYAFSPAFAVTVGQFKRAFSVFDLSSSADLPLIERDGRVGGVSVCPGVGGVCSFSRLSEKLQLDSWDMGLRLDGALGARVAYEATVTNGTGGNVRDENDAKSYSLRVGLTLAPGVVLSPFAALHDYLDASGATRRAPAWGGDLEVGSWRDGLHLMAAAAHGRDWKVSDDAGFSSAQVMATYYAAGTGRVAGVEPLLRVSWSSAEGAAGAGAARGLLMTPGVMVYVTGKDGLALNWDVYRPGEGPTEWSLKVQSFLYF